MCVTDVCSLQKTILTVLELDEFTASNSTRGCLHFIKQIVASADFETEHSACRLYNFLWIYIPPIILLFGSVGNILAFLVLGHPSSRCVSAFTYLAVRSIVDEIVLISGLARRWIDYLIGARIENMSNMSCKLAQFLGTSSSILSVWLTVLLTAERTLVVAFPLRLRYQATPSKAYKIIAFTTFLCIAVSSHFFFTVELIPKPDMMVSNQETFGENSGNSCAHLLMSSIKDSADNVICNFKPDYATFGQCWLSIDATIYSYLPFCLIIGFNIALLQSVYTAQKQQRHLHLAVGSLKRKNTGSNTEPFYNIRQLTVMLLIVSFSFLITTLAIVMMKILAQLYSTCSHWSKNKQIAFLIADTVAELLMYVNHALTFYLFCATGKRVRSRLVSIINQWRKRGCRAYRNTGGMAKQPTLLLITRNSQTSEKKSGAVDKIV